MGPTVARTAYGFALGVLGMSCRTTLPGARGSRSHSENGFCTSSTTAKACAAKRTGGTGPSGEPIYLRPFGLGCLRIHLLYVDAAVADNHERAAVADELLRGQRRQPVAVSDSVQQRFRLTTSDTTHTRSRAWEGSRARRFGASVR